MIRLEIRGHAKALRCSSVLGYRETCTIVNDCCILTAMGTAAMVRRPKRNHRNNHRTNHHNHHNHNNHNNPAAAATPPTTPTTPTISPNNDDDAASSHVDLPCACW